VTSQGEVLPVVGLDRETLAKDLEAIKGEYDLVFIDGAPQSGRLAAAAIKAADLVLIPVTPSPYDVWACADLVEAIKACQEVTDGKPSARFLIRPAFCLAKYNLQDIALDVSFSMSQNGIRTTS
jgi:chromosome partitioning protein